MLVKPLAAFAAQVNIFPTKPKSLCGQFIKHFSGEKEFSNALVIENESVKGDLIVSPDSSFLKTYKNVGCVVSLGDLVVDGDIINDSHHATPFILVFGDLYVRNWLRGGITSFISGDIHADGYLVGKYEDGGLFVGGSLNAMGYINRRKPYPDRPKLKPHQINGSINAEYFDASKQNISSQDLRNSFIDAVLTGDNEEELWFNPDKILEFGKNKKSIWQSK